MTPTPVSPPIPGPRPPVAPCATAVGTTGAVTATPGVAAVAVGAAVPEPAGTTLDGRIRPLPSTEPWPADVRGREPILEPPARPVPAPDDEVPVPARRAAHALIVMALEVVDRRRAPQNTRGAFPPHLVEMLRTLARVGVPGQQLGPARIHRLHIHAAGAPTPETGPGGEDEAREYEVCATYARGPRLFAVAARIRVTPTGAGCAALRLV